MNASKPTPPSKRKALLVGINDYHWGPLNAPDNDAKEMKRLLSYHYDNFENFECEVFSSTTKTPERITQGTLTKKIKGLFEEELDAALFYFSGHGRTDKLGGYIITQEGTKNDPGVPFSNIIDLAIASDIKEVVLIFDCCYSGEAANFGRFGRKISMLREGLTVLSASQANQTALEVTVNGKSQSLFTSFLSKGLQGAASDLLGVITPSSLYTYTDQMLRSVDQRPIFKSDTAQMFAIKNSGPRVPIDKLKKIIRYFLHPDTPHQLDPSYEPTLGPPHPKNEAIFKDLQLFRAKSLVEPINEEHMYFEAENHGACRLTDKGKLYWELVRKNKLGQFLPPM